MFERGLVLGAAFILTGCATVSGHDGPASEDALFAAFEEAQLAFKRQDFAGIDAALARAKQSAKGDVILLDRVASLEQAMLVERDDLEGAWARMVERLAALDKAGHVAHAQHDEAIFMCEARRDALCAVLEASEMMAAATRVDELKAQEMMLGNWWQRAHTLLAFAQTADGPSHSALMAYAAEARAQFVSLATQFQRSLGSVAVLSEQFEALGGHCDEALETARSLKLESLDPQDAYITAQVFEKCGDAQAASKTRDHILANTELSLFSSVYRSLARFTLAH